MKAKFENTKISELLSKIENKLSECASLQRMALDNSSDIFEELVNEIVDTLQLKDFSLQETMAKEKSTFLPHLKEQLYQSYRHISMQTGHGQFTYKASIEFLKEAQDFICCTEPQYYPKINSIAHLSSMTPGERQERMQTLKKENTRETKTLIDNPMQAYHSYKQRLSQDLNTPFPEFQSLIEYFKLSLSDERIEENIINDPTLKALRALSLERLDKVAQDGFHYADTIHAIERTIAFLDVHERGRIGGTTTPLYHSRRWRYHAHYMKAQAPEYILFPTIRDLGVTDLLKVRAAPIGIMGANINCHFVDGHSQTPLEFWYHDINHSRRMWAQQLVIGKSKGLTVEEYAMECQECIDECIKILSIPKEVQNENPELCNKIRIARTILFEILHEDALPADKEIIKEALSRPPCGVARFVNENQGKDGAIVYSTDPNATVLSFVYQKLAGDFYDIPEKRMIFLGADEYRTRDMVGDAAIYVSDALKLEINEQVLRTNVSDDSALPQGFRNSIIEFHQRHPNSLQPILNETAAEGKVVGFNETNLEINETNSTIESCNKQKSMRTHLNQLRNEVAPPGPIFQGSNFS